MKPARTRFAPSPTGLLHVGGIRTALFAWLIARQTGGQFVLRLEDTDQKREVAGADQHIIDSLKTLGLDFDEGPVRQSERLDIYKKWAEKLIQAGRAYPDPYSPEQLNQFREEAKKNKKPFRYVDHRPTQGQVWNEKVPLRFLSKGGNYRGENATKDVVMRTLETGPEAIDDFIIIKSDGYPTYNFAHIVDDIEMGITHVIRGQEFLASLPNYRNLYEALNEEPPLFATVPHILNEQGNKKLSKRDGAKDVLDYIRDGFLPEALVSFIATLGWNDGTEQDVFTVNELIQKFSLERVGRGGAHFDEKRLLWVNGEFIRRLPPAELENRAQDFWPPEAENYDIFYKKQVLGLIQERLKFFAEIPDLTLFFFKDLPVDSKLISEHKQLSKLDKAELRSLLEQAKTTLEASDFTSDDLQKRLNGLLQKTGQKPAVLFSLVRIATTQAPASPGLADTLAVLGKTVSLRRLQQQLEALE